MPKVYVFGALMPMGGAYMAYHIGRLLHLHFGYEFVDVSPSPAPAPLFSYDIPITTVTPLQMQRAITDRDILVANPSYSHAFFGLRLRGRKIMYIQDYKTYQLLDCHFDLYVSVSSLVQRYVEAVYAMATPVIPAFIDLKHMPPAVPWHERPAGSALVYQKHPNAEHTLVLQYLRDKAPHIDFSHVVTGRDMPHRAFLQALGSVRYLVNLSLAEGFGLVPLEAMALGTMVTGLNSLGSADYMRSGENCLSVPPTDLRKLPAAVMRAMEDDALAVRCAQEGQKTAATYGYDAFKRRWLNTLAAFEGSEPVNA